MTEDLEKVQDILLERVNQMCRDFGLNNIMAQLYVILYLSNKPLSLDDMVTRLRISKGSVSVNIRALERYDVVRRVWVKGSRKDYYEAETDIYKVAMDRIKWMAQRRLAEVENIINLSFKTLDSINLSDNEEKEAMDVFRQRLNSVREIHDKAQSIFDLFSSGLLTDTSDARDVKVENSNSSL